MIYEKYIYYILGDYYDMMRERGGKLYRKWISAWFGHLELTLLGKLPVYFVTTNYIVFYQKSYEKHQLKF